MDRDAGKLLINLNEFGTRFICHPIPCPNGHRFLLHSVVVDEEEDDDGNETAEQHQQKTREICWCCDCPLSTKGSRHSSTCTEFVHVTIIIRTHRPRAAQRMRLWTSMIIIIINTRGWWWLSRLERSVAHSEGTEI